ncbi:MAG: OmpH family outer membrane protein [Oceanobacter sp.]
MRFMVMFAAVAALLSGNAVASKVAVVDMERALFLSDAAKVSAKKFEKDNKADISKVKGVEKELLALKERLEKDGAIMSEDESRKIRSQYDKKAEEMQFFMRKLQQQDQQWRRQFFQSQLPELEKTLKAIIDNGKYDVVLQAGAVIYHAPDVDLTKVLLERLNGKK